MPLTARGLVRNIQNIASLPSIYERLSEVINHPRSSASDIGKVVSDDPGLTARMLRIVNSAFFGFPSKIDTVSRALMIVGTDQLRDLALATSVVKVFEKVPQDLIDMDSFWYHSLACGVLARVLATQRNESNVERYFVAGLMHDIGTVIMLMKEPEKTKQIMLRAEEEQDLLHITEQKVLGFDHSDVGGLLMEEWNLPVVHREAVAFHNRPELAKRFPKEAALVHAADVIADGLQLGSSGEKLVPTINETAWKSLNIPEANLSQVITEAEGQLEDAVKIILRRE